LDLIRTVLSRCASLFRKERLDADLDEELRTHIAFATEENIERGLPHSQARTAALRSFGGVTQIRETYRNQRDIPMLEQISRDLRFALRQLSKSPGFAITAILTLALGIGASTAVFSLVNTILLKPLPYPNADKAVVLWHTGAIGSFYGNGSFPWGTPELRLLRDSVTSFQQLGAFKQDSFNLTGSGNPELLDGVRASADFFPSLGMPPLLGRSFSPLDDQPGHEYVVVLSHSFWSSHFNSDRGIVGKSINLNGYPYTVIGVMPSSFLFPNQQAMPPTLDVPKETALWVPLAGSISPAGSEDMGIVADVKPGVNAVQMQQELRHFDAAFIKQFPRSTGWSTVAVPLMQQAGANAKRPLLLLLASVLVVLLIASSNVAGLTLNRSLARRKEFTLRAALGAGRGRLIRQLITESLLLSLAGAFVGIFLGQAALFLLKLYGPATVPYLREARLDLPVILFAFGITLLTGLLFGLAPAFGATRMNMVEALKERGQRSSGGSSAPLVRNTLLIGQIGMAMVLVVTAGLLVRTFYQMLRADTGFDATRVMSFKLPLSSFKYSDPDRMAQLYEQVSLRLQTLAGVESVGFSSVAPMSGTPDGTVIRIPEHPTAMGSVRPFAYYSFVSPGYFSSIGTPVRSGRDIADTDTSMSMPAAIINATLAREYFPGEDPIGRQIGVGNTRMALRTIVGVVGDIKHTSLRESANAEMFVPYTQNDLKVWPSMQSMQYAVKTKADPVSAMQEIRQTVHDVDPDIPITDLATLTTVVDSSLTADRFSMLLLSAFGILALLLASIGMYGVISWSVMQRTAEIGIRIALGAQRRRILIMILSQGGRLACAGIGIGLIAAFATTRLISRFLYGVQPTDPATFAAVSLLLVAVALLACYLPARRAMQIDPMRAIRLE
jgi:predicted permease